MISIKQIAIQILDSVRQSYNDLSYVVNDLAPILVMETGEYMNNLDQYEPSWDMIHDTVQNYVQGKTVTLVNKAYTIKSMYDDIDPDYMNLVITQVGTNVSAKLLSVDVANDTKFIINDIKHVVGVKAEEFADVLVDGANINTVIYDGIDTAKQYGSSLLTKQQDANDLITAFSAKVQSDIPNLKGQAAAAFNMLKSGMKNGLTGVLSSVSNLYNNLGSLQSTSDSSYSFTDNSQYQVKHFAVGIADFATSIGNLITSVLAKIHPVIALLTQALTTGIANVAQLLAGALDNYYYAGINTNDPDYYEFPYAVMKGTLSKSDYRTIYEEIMNIPEMQEQGAIRIFCPGFSYYIWKEADTEVIDFQVKLCADININAIEYLKTQGIVTLYKQGTSATNGDYIKVRFQDESYFERWGILYNAYLNNTDLPTNGTSSEVNTELLSRFRSALSFFLCSIFFSVMESSAVSEKTFTFDGNAQTQADQMFSKLVVIGYNCYASTSAELYANTCRMDSWEYIYIPNDTTSQSVIAFFEENFNALTYYPITNWAIMWQIVDVIPEILASPWWTYAGSIIASVPSLGEDYITIPTYTRKSVIAGLIIAGVVIAAITAIAVISTVKIKRMIQSKRAIMTSQAEKAWDNLKSNPSPENYQAYRKAARANNKFVKVFGGSSLDYNGYWQDTSSDISSVSTKNDNVDMDNIVTLIQGYVR